MSKNAEWIELTGCDAPLFRKSFDAKKYTQEKIAAYGGKIETFKVKCNKYIIDLMIYRLKNEGKIE